MMVYDITMTMTIEMYLSAVSDRWKMTGKASVPRIAEQMYRHLTVSGSLWSIFLEFGSLYVKSMTSRFLRTELRNSHTRRQLILPTDP